MVTAGSSLLAPTASPLCSVLFLAEGRNLFICFRSPSLLFAVLPESSQPLDKRNRTNPSRNLATSHPLPCWNHRPGDRAVPPATAAISEEPALPPAAWPPCTRVCPVPQQGPCPGFCPFPRAAGGPHIPAVRRYAGLCVVRGEPLVLPAAAALVVQPCPPLAGVSDGATGASARGCGKEPAVVLSPCCRHPVLPPLPPSLLPHALALSLPVPGSLPPAAPLSLVQGLCSGSRPLEELPANVSVRCRQLPGEKGLELRRGRSSGSEGRPLFLTARRCIF